MATAKKKKISEERKIEKGIEGELIVQNALKQALDTLQIRYRIYSNVYLQFPSSYGGKYGFTTELDHIVVTEQYIFAIETKNQTYYQNSFSENRNSDYWHLDDEKNTTVINPMIQNYYHKMVLSEQLEIDREAILQLVCLKDIPPNGRIIGFKNYRSQNNHFLMFEDNDFVDNLCKLFMSKNQNHRYDFEDIINKMESLVKKQFLYKDHHIENLERADKILDYQFGTKTKLDTTDCAICPKCGHIMKIYLDEMPRYPEQKRRRHKFNPILRCSNEDCYYKSDFDKKGIEIAINWHSLYDVPIKKIVNSDIEIRTIEERLGYFMIEDYQQTVYDEIRNLKQELKNEKDNVSHQKWILEDKYKQIKELWDANQGLVNKNQELKKELDRYKHLIGNIYTKK